MNGSYVLVNSILWASAIVGAAILKAPDTLTLLVLPALGAMSLLGFKRRTGH